MFEVQLIDYKSNSGEAGTCDALTAADQQTRRAEVKVKARCFLVRAEEEEEEEGKGKGSDLRVREDMSGLQFHSVLLDISNQLAQTQLEDMKFLCRDFVGKRELEKITSGTQLFQVLTERGRLAAGNTQFLSQLLTRIHRSDLSDKLDNFESGAGSSDDQPNAAERAKLDLATEVIAENLGRNWRKLGRKLGVTEAKLDSVATRHTDLDETARELLKVWRKSRGAEARTSDLVAALRACQFVLTAEKVEERLQAP
ncbi:FAS-associated death domain protein [Liparis tanakae]|uniref:FAS-associated death domain protein n=1 Tax=Liparis tanakae TaxID=230148 RepID=A0A4Z2GFP1_9TELE|nr:FAS-associated death domain protein [Liparis tanakae]